MKHPLNEGMERRANEIKTEQIPQQIPITAEVAFNRVANFLERQEQVGLWHKEMSACMVYLYKNAKDNEDRIQAENQP